MEALTLLGIDPKLVALQLLPFAVALIGLHYIIFKPMLAMLVEREKNIHGFRRDAELLQEEVTTKVAELEGRLAEARIEASAERGRLRQEASELEQEILSAARAKSEVLLAEARTAIEVERLSAEAQLQNSAAELSRQIVSTVLGRDSSGSS